MAQFKVFYISDSLGIPASPRGIHHYSLALIEMLEALGAELTLVVERAEHFGVSPASHSSLVTRTPRVIRGAQLNEVFRYFLVNVFHARRDYASQILQALANQVPSVVGFANSVVDWFRHRKSGIVTLNLNLTDILDRRLNHLLHFDKYLYIPFIYSSAIQRSATGTKPVSPMPRLRCRVRRLTTLCSAEVDRPIKSVLRCSRPYSPYRSVHVGHQQSLVPSQCRLRPRLSDHMRVSDDLVEAWLSHGASRR